jgi:nucleotide-binding universal stress UspA family protein
MKRWLVPLDRSPEAESVIPFVREAARGTGATVRLLHVAPPPQHVVSEGRVVAYIDQEVSRLESEGQDYLRTVEARMEGVPTESVVRFGQPATEILKEAEAFEADVIVVATKSRSALSRVVLGSAAERVLREAPVTVVLVRPGSEAWTRAAA